MSNDVAAIVLAAGEGKRMKSNIPKVLTPILGVPMVDLVLDALKEAGIKRVVTVVGHGASAVRAHLGDHCATAMQDQQLGTGHAVRCGMPALAGHTGEIIVTCGDTPLLTAELFQCLLSTHRREQNGVTVLTCVLEDGAAYGRIVRDHLGAVTAIVEYRDAPEDIRAIREINSGIYCFSAPLLARALEGLSNKNSQGEYYLTDAVAAIRGFGGRTGAFAAPDWRDCIGVNSRAEAAQAEEYLSLRIIARHFSNGITIQNPATVRIGPNVTIGIGTTILPGTILEGRAAIGDHCIVGPNMRIRGAELGNYLRIAPEEITSLR